MKPVLSVREIRPEWIELHRGDYYEVVDWDILAVEIAAAKVSRSVL